MPLRLSVLVLLVAAALLAGCGDDSDDAESTTTADYDITGSWAGELHQEGLDPFRVTADIQSLDDSAQNTVHYTGIDCSGTWSYEGRSGAAFRFREVIDSGVGGKCKGVGTVSLTPFADDGVDYQFDGGGVQSVGVLKRTG